MTHPRVAFFGGSFDPPHRGHLAIARAAQQALQLDTVLFAPVGSQPLKPHGSTAPFADRVAMTRMAIAGEPAFALSLVDSPTAVGRPNYTLDTLNTLRSTLPAQAELFCLMGADSFASLSRWKGGEEIPFAASLIVASRPGQVLEDLALFLPESIHIEAAEGSAKLAAPPGCNLQVRAYQLRDAAGRIARFFLLPGLDVEISASDIRTLIRKSNPADLEETDRVPRAVASYIREHHLYR